MNQVILLMEKNPANQLRLVVEIPLFTSVFYTSKRWSVTSNLKKTVWPKILLRQPTRNILPGTPLHGKVRIDRNPWLPLQIGQSSPSPCQQLRQSWGMLGITFQFGGMIFFLQFTRSCLGHRTNRSLFGGIPVSFQLYWEPFNSITRLISSKLCGMPCSMRNCSWPSNYTHHSSIPKKARQKSVNHENLVENGNHIFHVILHNPGNRKNRDYSPYHDR